MHTVDHTVPTKPDLERIRESDTFRVALILAVFAATAMALSALSNDFGLATQPSAQAAGIEEWHGNVARSGR
ncbi:hypothetical protein [Chachezhania antarctica]|uniref:hypothetical protein n=1 Tax=Chachezhania antarctica TaxID=2340860 RepID=UPI000EB53389|nr:hypothetical protein [Chachezhania antarctica]|tara:strand:+ start:3108 stop:3323 length:216 start_codon:yes stop_codon:yes gene_type:complete